MKHAYVQCTSSPTRIRVGIECSMEMFKWNHKDHLSIKPKCISKFECHTEEFTIHNTNACNKCTVFKVNGRLMLVLQKWTYQFYTDVNEVTVCLCVCLFTVSKSYAFKSKRMNHWYISASEFHRYTCDVQHIEPNLFPEFSDGSHIYRAVSYFASYFGHFR